MTEKEILDWAWYKIDGNPYHEQQILKIGLSDNFQKKYTDIDTMCRNAGLAPMQAEEVKQWKQHNKELDSYIFYTLYDYFVYKERERYLKAVNLYYKNNPHL